MRSILRRGRGWALASATTLGCLALAACYRSGGRPVASPSGRGSEKIVPSSTSPPPALPDRPRKQREKPIDLPWSKDLSFTENVSRQSDYVTREFAPTSFWYFANDGVMPNPYFVAAEKDERADREVIEREYAGLLTAFQRGYFELFASAPEVLPSNTPRVVYAFASEEAFDRAYRSLPRDKIGALGLLPPDETDGYYARNVDSVFVWRREDLPTHLLFAAARQLSTQLVHARGSDTKAIPLWFTRGIARYFSGYLKRTVKKPAADEFVAEYRFGGIVGDSYRMLTAAIETGEAFSIRSLLEVSDDGLRGTSLIGSGEISNRRFDVVDSEGWAFVHFLVEANEGKYLGLFRQFAKLAFAGEGDATAFARIYRLENDADWEDLDDEFMRYVYSDLRDMAHSRRVESEPK